MNNIKDLFKLLTGIFIIFFLLWQRLIHQRTPQDYSSISTKDIINYIFLVISFTCLIIYTIKRIYGNHVVNPNAYFLRLQTIIKTYIIDTPAFVYERVTRNINLAPLLELPASYFTAYFNYPRLFVILFYFVPQTLVALIFLIEMYFYHQQVFFIKILSVSLIFLIAKTIIFIFKHYSERRLNHYNLFFDIKQDNEGISISLKAPEMLPKHIPLEDIVNQYNNMYLTWIVYNNIHCYMLEIEHFNKQYSYYVRLMIYIFFLLGWLSLLYFYFFSTNLPSK